jgi:hypothetical protein
MPDVFVYHFIPWTGNAGGNARSLRPATLAAIKLRGEPIMESQMVVDHREVDGDGFLIASVGYGPSADTNLLAQIKSLELRAGSRDLEAAGSDDERASYMLQLESRELRAQARRLKVQVSGEMRAGERPDSSGAEQGRQTLRPEP